MELFAGTFGAIRNAVSHTDVGRDNPTAAAERVLLVDLLMRELGHVERRVSDP